MNEMNSSIIRHIQEDNESGGDLGPYYTQNDKQSKSSKHSDKQHVDDENITVFQEFMKKRVQKNMVMYIANTIVIMLILLQEQV